MLANARQLVCILAAALACAALLGQSAQAQISFGPCRETNNFACGQLTVPLDWSGQHAGTIKLAIRRHRAPVGESKIAVIALAGGPGQAANPFAAEFAQALGPIIATRDLIVFDQRGTGNSHPLSCHAFEGHIASSHKAITTCAQQIGPARAFYTTAQSVQDIEAIRQAGGYEKLVLYGTSYGTKVAERYAQEYPQYVQALILDSVVPPNGPDQTLRNTMTAVPRVLKQLCSFGVCRHITSSPVHDLRRMVARLDHHRVRGRYISGRGVARTIRLTSNELLEALISGDLEPTLRAEFPAAVNSALRGDTAALARMLSRGREAEGSSDGIDVPLYYATTCEEETFPFSRAASPRQRLRQGRQQLRATPASAFSPFTRANAFDLSDIGQCAFWPFADPGPEVNDTTLPNVPTLILSGADDLRTPTANAREVARQIPGARLLIAPNTGHSVLGSDPSSCSAKALQAFFKNKPLVVCKPEPPPALLRPIGLAPTRLSSVRPAHSYSGNPGRTLHAVELTLGYFFRQLSLQSMQSEALLGGLSLDSGGLRSGWASYSLSALSFHRYCYIPGVVISGQITTGHAELQIAGATASSGVLHLGPKQHLSGVLGGVPVHLSNFDPQATIAGAQALASAVKVSSES
ncbi:MAG: alpha/beta hydrolase [Solirubrobacteraceae bacterium]